MKLIKHYISGFAAFFSFIMRVTIFEEHSDKLVEDVFNSL